MKSLSGITLCGIAVFLVIDSAASLAWTQTPASQTTPLIVGTWKLNIEKSSGSRPANSFEIRQYRLRPDGYLVGLLITGNPTQGYHYLQFTARSDGKDYPEYTDQLLAEMTATGKQSSRTYAERIVDDYTTDWTDKVNGNITAHGKKVISKDGKTLTVTSDGTSQIFIYDRQ